MQATNWVAGLTGVTKRYGANVALDGVSLGIGRGQVTALLGPNGAGKSTAVALLLGLAGADEGRVDLFGQSPQVLAARRRIGVMLQSAGLIETLRVGELVELTSSYYLRPRTVSEVAEMAGIGELLRKPCGALSGGQQRRVQFALAICGRPELLFLDEPTTGLDIEARETLWTVVRGLVSEGCAVLLTTHYLEEAEALAHRVAVLARGRIVAEGTVDEIRAMGVRRRIRCVSALSVEEVRGWEGVEVVVEDAPGVVGAEGAAAENRATLLDLGGAAARGRAASLDVGTGARAVSVGAFGAARGGGLFVERRRLEISAVVGEAIVRRLLESDPELSELEVARAGLAEAFVQITKEELMRASEGLAREARYGTDSARAVSAREVA